MKAIASWEVLLVKDVLQNVVMKDATLILFSQESAVRFQTHTTPWRISSFNSSRLQHPLRAVFLLHIPSRLCIAINVHRLGDTREEKTVEKGRGITKRESFRRLTLREGEFEAAV